MTDSASRNIDLRHGRATPEGTARYRSRFPDAADGHFRQALGGLWLSSIGLGTGGYVGHDREPGVVEATVTGGINVVDTAINYGNQRAERSVGRGLYSLFESGRLSRDEVLVCSKGGYLPFGTREFDDRFIRTGLCQPSDVVDGVHCLAPAFLDEQLSASRRNLSLETIDIYLLHNPEEQLAVRDDDAFAACLVGAFGALERAAEAGHIGSYGVSVAPPVAGDMPFPRLDRLLAWAHQVAGAKHHFRAVEVPVNLWLTHAVFDDRTS